MQKENLLDKFADRSSKVIKDTDGTGWGFHDYLADVYFNFYPDNIDEIDDEDDKEKIIKIERQ
jgi:hypothetical protein